MKKLFILLVSLSLIACSSTEHDDASYSHDDLGHKHSDGLNIVTTIPPLYSIVLNLVDGIENVEVTNIVPPNTSVHYFNLTPSVVKDIEEADLLVMNGLELELFLEDIIGSSSAKVLDTSEGVTLRKYEEHEEHEEHEEQEGHEEHEEHEEQEGHEEHDEQEGHEEHDEHDDDHEDHDDHKKHDDHEGNDDHDHCDEGTEQDPHDHSSCDVTKNGDDHEVQDDHEGHDDHNHGMYDPHIWLSPLNVEIQAANIFADLIELDPNNSGLYELNYMNFLTKLDELDKEISSSISEMDLKAYVVLHDAYYYFENSYGISSAAHVQEFAGQDPSPEYLSGVVEIIRSNNVEVVFSEPQFAPKLVEVLSEDYGLKIGELDPLGQTLSKDGYFELMRFNLDALKQAFHE